MRSSIPWFHSQTATILLIGDILTLGVITVIGFANHGELGTAGTRMLTTFVPLVVAWLLVAPYLGVFDPQNARDFRQLWRPFWAMVLCSPLAAWMRGVWLGSAILPIFVVVLGGLSALALLAWRFGFWLFSYRKR
jgi:hypothetical protein